MALVLSRFQSTRLTTLHTPEESSMNSALPNLTHHALASIARRTDPDKIPQVPYGQKGSQYGYPSLDGLRNGGPTLWITALLLGLYAGSTGSFYSFLAFYSSFSAFTYLLAHLLLIANLCIVTHLGQAIHSRKWFLIPSAVACGLVEVIGWAGAHLEREEPIRRYAVLDADLDYCLCVRFPSPPHLKEEKRLTRVICYAMV